jgi:hypothetical protein
MVVSLIPMLCTVCPLFYRFVLLQQRQQQQLGLLLSSVVREWIDKQSLQTVPIFSFFSTFQIHLLPLLGRTSENFTFARSLAHKRRQSNKQFCLLSLLTHTPASKHGDLTSSEQRCASLAAIDLCRTRPPIRDDALGTSLFPP